MFPMILPFFLFRDTGKIPVCCSDWENETHSSSEEDESEADDTESYEEENETKVLCLSAGAGNVVVVEDESFLPPVQLSPGGPWVSFKDPRKSSLPHFHGRAHLNKAAKFKHIDPTCRSEEDAERKSLERNSRYRQKNGEYNTVFKVHPDDFILEPNATLGKVLKSREAVRNWKCKKISDSKYEGVEEREMHAVFKEGSCHYSLSESRKTRRTERSFKLGDFF